MVYIENSQAGRKLAAAAQQTLWVVCLAALGGCSSSSSGSTAPADGGAAGGPMGPPGKIYVSMYGDDDVTVIDQATHAILSKIPVGKGPAVLLATPDAKKLYTANWSDNTVSAIDLATSSSKPIALDGRPWAIAMSPTGNKLWVGVASNKLVAIDTTTDGIVTTYDTSPDFPESVITSADGSEVYIDPASTSNALSAGTLESLSAGDGGVVHPPVMVGETPAWASISPDGSRAYTLNFLAGSVSVVDTAAWQTIATLDAGSGSQPIISTSTPNGTLLVTNFGTANLMTFDFKTNAMLHVFSLDGRPVGVGGYNATGTLGYVCDFGHDSLQAETIAQGLSFLNGDLSSFVHNGPGHVTAFNPATGEKIGDPILVGKGPTSVVVIAP